MGFFPLFINQTESNLWKVELDWGKASIKRDEGNEAPNGVHPCLPEVQGDKGNSRKQ